MELEFDKEIDAILRKEAQRTAAAGTLTAAHLEADEIAAFVENALPARARSNYTKHLADCDRCRTVLARTVSLMPEAEIDTASSAVSSGAIRDIHIPWYRKLFAIPNLAASMGALILVFAGLLAYLTYQQQYAGHSSDVAKVNEPETGSNRNPAFSEPTALGSNTTANTANSAANTAPVITSGGSPLTREVGQEEPTPEQLVPGERKQDTAVPGGDVDRLRDASPAQPASVPAAKEAEPRKTEPDSKKPADAKLADEEKPKPEVTSTDAVSENRVEQSKDAPAVNNQAQTGASGGLLKAKSGPYRDQQQKSNGNIARADDDGAGRRIAGKSFEKRDAVWYDSAYRGQSTVNVRRGTNEYRALDSGLRNIADSVTGTVVIVWKDKAYRIQ